MLYSLQAYRGIAALLVVLFHATLLVGVEFGSPPLGGFFSFGFGGVHLFFVLSGFLMMFAHGYEFGQAGKIKSYIYKRVARIYPIYLVLLSFGVVGYIANVSNVHIYYLIENISLIKLTRFEPIIPVAWTLFYEILFYILFSLFFFGHRVGFMVVLFWMFILIAVNMFGMDFSPPYSIARYTGIDYGAVTSFVKMATSKLNFLFFFGMLAFVLYKNFIDKGNNVLVLVSFFSGIIFWCVGIVYWLVLFEYDRSGWSNDLVLVVCFGIGSASLLASSASFNIDGLIGSNKYLLFIGDASYSIYLAHLPVLKVLINIYREFCKICGCSSFVFWLFSVVLSVLVGIALHLLVDAPLQKKLKRVAIA